MDRWSREGSALWQASQQATAELVFGKEVAVNTYGFDKFDRTIAGVSLSDGTNVNQELVKAGWCW